VPRIRSCLFRSQVIPRYKRRDKAVDDAICSIIMSICFDNASSIRVADKNWKLRPLASNP